MPRPASSGNRRLSSSSSNEADDEGSPDATPFTSPDEQPMAEHTIYQIKPQYPGEDTRLTSKKELWGWYSYGWAVEVFVVCGVGSFIPITLEQLAREHGVLENDRTKSCTTGLDTTLPPMFNGTSPAIPRSLLSTTASSSKQCLVNFLGLEINTASFAMYAFSFSVLIQAIVVITMSAAADHGRYRKTFLIAFAWTGALATMLFLPITSNVYWIGAILAVISNTCFGASFVLLNSFLPLLVRFHSSTQQLHLAEAAASPQANGNGFGHHPRRRRSSARAREGDNIASLRADDDQDSTTALLGPSDRAETIPSVPKPSTAASPELQLSTRLSSNGIAIGYTAAVLVQMLAVCIVLAVGGTTFSLKLVLFLIGVWWLIFSIPSAMWLRPRPGPPLALPRDKHNQPVARGWIGYITFAWLSLYRTVLKARHLRDMLTFLAAWFLLSDGIATVSGTAVLFAKTTLGMAPAALAMINVVVMCFGVLGAFVWSALSRRLRLRPIHTILICVALFELIPIYALLSYIPAVKRLGFIGLQKDWEMYPLAAVYGMVMAGLSSYCRSLFGEMIPPGFEAAFYALYAITDKGSSVFGPAIVGAITDATGEIRPAFWFLAVLIGLPLPLLWLVDVDRGRIAAVDLAKELERGKVLEANMEIDAGAGASVEGNEEVLLRS